MYSITKLVNWRRYRKGCKICNNGISENTCTINTRIANNCGIDFTTPVIQYSTYITSTFVDITILNN